MSDLLRLSIVSSLDHTANFGDGTIYVDGTPTAAGVTPLTDQFGVQPSLGMSVRFAGQFLGPFTQ